LVIQASNAAGDFSGRVKSIFIQISPPFWLTWWFISLVGIVISIAVYALFRFRLNQKMRVLNVRQKLHRDLHDDVGATLSSIKVYSEVLQGNADKDLIAGLIKYNAEDMLDKLEIISWATNPQHDTFKSFKELVRKYASTICYAKNIEPCIQCGDINENMMMPGDIRRNLFLIFKEAINNTMKYSEASQCSLHMYIRGYKFYFIVSDNGKGADGFIKGNGYGWKNMEKRTQELNGLIAIESSQGNGTVVRVVLPYPFRIPNLWYNRKVVL
jgi:signal transduction histidine kinase